MRWFLIVFVALALYVLSVGPMLRICGVKPSAGRRLPPAFVRVFYAPLFASHLEFINGPLDHYIMWWIGDD